TVCKSLLDHDLKILVGRLCRPIRSRPAQPALLKEHRRRGAVGDWKPRTGTPRPVLDAATWHYDNCERCVRNDCLDEGLDPAMSVATRPRIIGRLLRIPLAPLRWLERTRGRWRLALGLLYLVVLAVVVALTYRETSLWGLPDIGDPFDVEA